jgi:hypothetical protein
MRNGNEELRYTLKAALVSQGVRVQQFEKHVYRGFDCDVIIHSFKTFQFKKTQASYGNMQQQAPHECKLKILKSFLNFSEFQ